MSSESEEVNTQLNKKLNTANKNLKLLIDMVKTLDEKVDANKPATSAEEKEKMQEIFEKKGVEKPKGSFGDKQKQYLRMLRGGKIKEPKQSTLDYYKIVKDFDGNYELMVDALK